MSDEFADEAGFEAEEPLEEPDLDRYVVRESPA